MRSFDEWFDENCDGSDLAKDACRKLWDEFSDQINIICRKSYEKQQSKVDELKLQVAEMKSRLNDAYTAGQSAMYAARQSKVDELQKKLDEYIFVAESIDEMYVKEVQKNNELQKRFDVVLQLIESWNSIAFDKTTHWTEGYEEGCYHCAAQLEQALKGGCDE